VCPWLKPASARSATPQCIRLAARHLKNLEPLETNGGCAPTPDAGIQKSRRTTAHRQTWNSAQTPEGHVSPESQAIFDEAIQQPAAKQRTLGDLEAYTEHQMVAGTGLGPTGTPS